MNPVGEVAKGQKERPKRLVLAALAGAAAMFLWSAVSHTTLIRGTGFTRLPSEDALVRELSRSIHADGTYFFPGIDWSKNPPAEEQSAWQERFRTGPSGLLLYHVPRDVPVSSRKLLFQLLGDLLASAIAASMVSRLAASYWRRVLVVGALGVFGCLGVSALFWTWYGFSDAFFLAHCFDKIVGWLIAGAAIAWATPSARSTPS